jgi:hypothetical protein
LRIGSSRAIHDVFDIGHGKAMLIDLGYVLGDPFEVMHRFECTPNTLPRHLHARYPHG